MAKFIYSRGYWCDVGAHVFRTEKYGLLHDKMLEMGLARPDDFVEPKPASRRDLELIHTPEYVGDLFSNRHTMRTVRSEMPISRQIVEAFALGAGGTVLACRLAVAEHTFTMNMAGGFHHAFPDWAEGFCYINDVALGVAKLRHDGLIRKAMVVDCDLHQGNGTAYMFRDEPDVFTFSIHEEYIYPVKGQSDLDIGLPGSCSGAQYLAELEEHLLDALETHRPEFVLYVAGADPYREDMLGTLMLEIEDLKRRDEIVLGACAERDLPAAAVLAGGYAPLVEDTVRIHYNTAAALVALSDKVARGPDA
ncbi:MAG: histone deacetylase [Candidatus Brocadiae bacterium]|nr:histone deacetylase [Candidatus Brocadiia bacterium]